MSVAVVTAPRRLAGDRLGILGSGLVGAAASAPHQGEPQVSEGLVAILGWTVHQIHQMLLHRHLTPELAFGNGETLLIRSELPAYLTGRLLTEFDVDGEIRVVEVTRAGRSLVPSHSTPAEVGDLVTFAVAATALGRLRGFLDKELGA